MKKLLLVLLGLVISVSFVSAGASTEEQPAASAEMEMGEALGLYPEFFQFGSLTEMEGETGIKITEFGESPDLAALVAKGELDPVEERLPEQPLVIVRNETGRYGGTLRTSHDGGASDVVRTINKFMEQMPYTYDPDYNRLGVNILLESELLPSGTEYLWRLRKGMRWSDGMPMTADDYMFWYEAVAMNKDLSPGGIREFKSGGVMGTMEKLAEDELKITFPSPFGYFSEQIAIFRPGPFLPTHYMKQFHPDYTSDDELNATIKEEGFSDWVSLWTAKRTHWTVENPDMPHIRPWIMTTDGRAPVNRLLRNPYFWKIDTAGNQLPYIDEVESVLIADQEGKKLSVIAGDIDYITGGVLGMTAETFALLKENESKAGYNVVSSPGDVGNQHTIFVNLAHPDPVLREIFMEKDFRIALSIGVNRNQVNEVLFRGSRTPTQVRPNTPYGMSDPLFNTYLKYTPDEANKLLDGIGLTWNRDKTKRMRADGKPMDLIMGVYTAVGPIQMQAAEMYQQYYSDLGIGLTLKPYDEATINKIYETDKYDLMFAQAFGGGRGYPIVSRHNVVPIQKLYYPAPGWGKWLFSEGMEGVEPPDDVKQLAEMPAAYYAEGDPEKREAMEHEIFEIMVGNLYIIGGMDEDSSINFAVYSKNLRNQVGKIWARYHHVASAWYLAE